MNVSRTFSHFNSHAHVERDLLRTWKTALTKDFNSHAHVERDSASSSSVSFIPNFNSHAHVERDSGQFNSTVYKNNFNSHAHVERDLYGKSHKYEYDISTHTLTWSVTFKEDFRLAYIRFQLTRSRGAWLVTISSALKNGNFNSHAHVERDCRSIGK